MNFPGSPYFVLENLLEEYRNGRRTPEQVLASLDIFDMFLEQYNEGLQALPVEPEVLPEGEQKLEECYQGLQCFADASACFRDYLESGDEDLAAQALDIARQGHESLEQLYLTTAKKVEELQNEVG